MGFCQGFLSSYQGFGFRAFERLRVKVFLGFRLCTVAMRIPVRMFALENDCVMSRKCEPWQSFFSSR